MLLPTIVILIIIVRRVIQFHPTGRSRWKGLQWVLSDATDVCVCEYKGTPMYFVSIESVFIQQNEN
jgi:hypothetical protein